MMNQDLEGLEQDLERRFEAMALELDVDPPPAAAARVREEVQFALNEVWLKTQPQPLPDAVALTRVVTAVRRELGWARLAAPRRWLTVGAAAAAAALLIAGLRGVGPAQNLTGGIAVLADDEEALEQFVQAADRVWAEDPLAREIRDDLEAIEDSITRFSVTDDAGLRGSEDEDLDSRLNVPGRTLGRVGDLPAGAVG
jgi:hypothetical protein